MIGVCALHAHYRRKSIHQPKYEYLGGKVEVYPHVDVDFMRMTAIKSLSKI